MPRPLTRRLTLMLLLVIAGCASQPPSTRYPPLDFGYLRPIPLNVASIEIDQQYFPSGLPPDVTQYDPANPEDALKLMAGERLHAVGATGRGVFIINDASVTEQGETVTGTFAVTLAIYDSAGERVGYAQATATRQISGFGQDLRGALYTLTSGLMQQMNVEFEYQVRRSLAAWIVSASAVPQPVQQAPLPATSPPPTTPPPPARPTPVRPSPATPPPPPSPSSPPATHAAPGLPPLGPVTE